MYKVLLKGLDYSELAFIYSNHFKQFEVVSDDLDAEKKRKENCGTIDYQR